MFRYWAFISYSHSDARRENWFRLLSRLMLGSRPVHRAWGEWLAEHLESFPIPADLVKPDLRPLLKPTLGWKGRRFTLYPVFRDRDELPAGELDEAIKGALRASRWLIVVCGANARENTWVNREIDYFRSLEHGTRVLLFAGNSEHPAKEIPRSLPSMLVADARPGADGPARAVTRLIAPMLGVEFDQLWKRELKRLRRQRLRRMFFGMVIITGASVLSMGIYNEQIAREQEESRRLAQLANEQTQAGNAVNGALISLFALPSNLSKPEFAHAQEAEAALGSALLEQREIAVLHGPGVLLEDAGLVAYAAPDNQVRLYDYARRQEIGIRSVKGLIEPDQITSDGRTLVYQETSLAPDLMVHDLVHDRPNGRISVGEEVYKFALSPDGSRAVAYGDKVSLWSVPDGEQIAVLDQEPAQNSLVIFTPDSRKLVTMGEKLQLWDAISGQLLAATELVGSAGLLAANQDGSIVTIAAGSDVLVWQPSTDAPPQLLGAHAGDVQSLSLSSDGTKLLTTGEDHNARLFDLEQKVEVSRFVHPDFPLTDGLLDEVNGAWLLAALDGEIMSYNPDRHRRLRSLRGQHGRLRLFLDATRGFIVSSGPNTRIWRLDLAARTLPIESQGDVTAVRFLPGTPELVAGDHHGRIWRFRRDGGTPRLAKQAHGGKIRVLAASADGKLLSGSADGTAKLWRMPDFGLLDETGPFEAGVTAAALHPAGRGAVIGFADGNVGVRFTGDPALEILHALHGDSRVTSLAFAPDGKRFASAGEDRIAAIWSFPEMRPIVRIEHLYPVKAVGFTPDGKVLISAGDEYTARLNRATDGSPIGELVVRRRPGDPHDRSVTGMAITKDGTRLVTAWSDGAVRQWMLPEGAELLPLELFPNLSWSLDVDETGRLLALAQFQQIRFIELPGSLPFMLDLACRILPRDLSRPTNFERLDNRVAGEFREEWLDPRRGRPGRCKD